MSDVIPFKRPLKSSEFVLRFLNSQGHKRDAEFYLNHFASLKPESFALIVLPEEVLKDDLDAVLFELRYLIRLSLYPILLIQCSNDFLERAEIENYFKKAKVSLHFIPDEVKDSDRLDLVKEHISKKAMPLLHLDPELDPLKEIGRMSHLTRTGRIILLRRAGGLKNQNDQTLISLINLKFESEKMKSENVLSQPDLHFFQEGQKLVEDSVHRTDVSIVSPNHLLRELFTVKGSGTLIQMGSQIKAASFDTLDPRSLSRLFETCYDAKVDDTLFKENFDHVYLEENYMAAGLVRNVKSMSYLAHFALGTEARGLGIGRDLWGEIGKNHQSLFWRSKPDRFINRWYVKHCEGMQKTKEWTVFWKGLQPNQIGVAIDYALSQPAVV